MKQFILGLFILLSCACQQAKKSSVMTLEEDVVDFGKIKKDSILKVYFDFRNTGSDTLRLINVSADCGCTEVNYKKENILPGQDGVIEVIYKPGTNNDSGIVSKNIAIRSNSVSPIKVVKIKGEVFK